MALKPKIGITMRLEYETDKFYLARYYSEALAAAGALPVLIPLIPDAEVISGIVGVLDGVLLPGSDSDIDPEYFGEHPHPKLGSVAPERDKTDLLVLAEAEKRELPVFAICFGMQSLNVSRGGSLIQDIVSQVEGCISHQQGVPRSRYSHKLTLEAGSFLETALGVGTTTSKVNSHHHQAIRNTGKDLRAVAWAADGLVEAIEDTRKGRFVIGVQWHPELAWETDPLSLSLFKMFVEAAAGKDEAAATTFK